MFSNTRCVHYSAMPTHLLGNHVVAVLSFLLMGFEQQTDAAYLESTLADSVNDTSARSAESTPAQALDSLSNWMGAFPKSVQEHNPFNVSVTKIHMVLSSHLDIGCKTAGCGINRPGEPNVRMIRVMRSAMLSLCVPCSGVW